MLKMNSDVIIGWIIVFLALSVLIVLTAWSFRAINKIDKGRHRSTRETLKELQRGR